MISISCYFLEDGFNLFGFHYSGWVRFTSIRGYYKSTSVAKLSIPLRAASLICCWPFLLFFSPLSFQKRAVLFCRLPSPRILNYDHGSEVFRFSVIDHVVRVTELRVIITVRNERGFWLLTCVTFVQRTKRKDVLLVILKCWKRLFCHKMFLPYSIFPPKLISQPACKQLITVITEQSHFTACCFLGA